MLLQDILTTLYIIVKGERKKKEGETAGIFPAYFFQYRVNNLEIIWNTAAIVNKK